MTRTVQREAAAPSTAFLPMWWRCVLVALGVIILCSCSSPAKAEEPAMAFASDLDDEYGDEYRYGADSDSYCEISDLACGSEGAMIHDPAGAFCAVTIADPYGPVVGPADEYLCDGGDFGTPAGVREDWRVEGLEEEDAIAHYDTLDGRTVVTPSNRVCIYAPRFAAIRRVVGPIAHEQPEFVNQMLDEQQLARTRDALPPLAANQRHGLIINTIERPASLFRGRQQAGELVNLQATMEAYNSLGAYANLSIIRTGEVSQAEKALVEKSAQAAITLTGIQAPQVVFGVQMAQAEVRVEHPGVVFHTDEPGCPNLRLIKLASTGHATSGEEVEFTLRFDNVGDQEIGNVTIVDNLTTRLEYVPNSATSSVDSQFSTEPNDSGSSILRWEIKAPVKPREGGILRFRAKVR